MNVVVIVLIVLFILLVSHLTVDKDIPDNLKTGGWIFFGVTAVLYVIFGMIL